MKETDRALTRRAVKLLEGIGYSYIQLPVHVVWNRRLLTAAGQANPGLVELNPQLKTIKGARRHIDQTMRHELAHIVASYRHGPKIDPHGYEWQQACSDLGISNEPIYHDLPLGKYRYFCRTCGAEGFYGKKLRDGAQCYICEDKGKIDFEVLF